MFPNICIYFYLCINKVRLCICHITLNISLSCKNFIKYRLLIMSVSVEANSSEFDLLKQRITEFETENFDLKNENQKVRKELESRIKDHVTRLAKVKQDSLVEQPQNERFKGQAIDVLNTVVDQLDDTKL